MKTESPMRWLLFGMCLALFVGALAWVTRRVLLLEEQRATAVEEAIVQEKVRLALWRMEAEASGVVVSESARPAHHYQPFHALADVVLEKDQKVPEGALRMPSPLLGTTPDFVKLHFERMAGTAFGGVCSPQTPMGLERELALKRYAVGREVTIATAKLVELERLLGAHPGWENEAGFQPVEIAGKMASIMNASRETALSQQALSFNEQAWRGNTLIQNGIQQQVSSGKSPPRRDEPAAGADLLREEVGEMRAIWLGHELLLVRKVMLRGGLRMQGVWLDWPKLEERLLAAVRDLLPAAALLPIHRLDAREDSMALVALPARLVPGALAVDSPGGRDNSGLRTALFLAWLCIIVAAVAIAIVLHRAMQLSERRAAFVSAVTHELRTPLTTFRLYSEMLADEMVPEGETRKAYLKTLCEESTRLTHLVENVLSFSRIERGRAAVRMESVGVQKLIERLEPRLRQRCDSAGLKLVMEAQSSAELASGRMDAMAVEQILFNLTDNACKYAAPESKCRKLKVTAKADRCWISLEVQDFGPGLPRDQMRRLFQPFSKSATDAAHSAPGVGLGLALSRRLAREMGGDLCFEERTGCGATFCLRLPRDDIGAEQT